VSNDLTVHKYNVEELRDYVRESLGATLFKVELSDAEINNAITDTLLEYGKRQPIYYSRIIDIAVECRAYPITHETGYGIFDVQFITDDIRPAAVFYMGLLGDQIPLNSVMLAEYDQFLRYRKTMMRATSVSPQWDWDEDTSTLYVYAPVYNLKACYFWMSPRALSQVRLEHQDWLRAMALARAKLVLGKVRSKFSGVLPGPAQSLQLNGAALEAEAREEIKELSEFLFSLQGDIPPLLR
jgi:hypothetical protein